MLWESTSEQPGALDSELLARLPRCSTPVLVCTTSQSSAGVPPSRIPHSVGWAGRRRSKHGGGVRGVGVTRSTWRVSPAAMTAGVCDTDGSPICRGRVGVELQR